MLLPRALVLLLSLAAAVLAAQPLVIESDATVHFAWDEETERRSLRSAMVRAHLGAPLTFALMHSHDVGYPAGAIARLPHRLVNHGAAPLRLRLSIRNQEGDAHDLVDLALHHDVDGDGRDETGERPLARDEIVTLAPGEAMELLVRGRVPLAATPGGHARLVVQAEDIDGGALLLRIDTVAVVERAPGLGLFVEKTASRRETEIGESIDYTVRVKNAGDHAFEPVVLRDELPPGFTYIRGTLRRERSTLADPAPGGAFSVPLGRLAPGATATLRYRVRVGPAALGGDGVNRARATAPGAESNLASARVELREGVFTTKGILIGRVFLDLDGDGLPGPADPGVPEVRLYLEDGTHVLTDLDGKFSLYGLRPLTHVLKLDPITLPRGAAPRLTSTRQARDAGSRFVDLRRHELHRADFALSGAAAVLQEIAARRARLGAATSDFAPRLDERLTPDGDIAPVADPRALPASGVVGGAPAAAVSSASPVAPVPETIPELSLPAPATDALAFLDLRDGAVLPSAQATIRVAGPAGGRFELEVNGVRVGEERIGSRTTLPGPAAELWTFVGVKLAAGENRLRLALFDAFGNRRDETSLRIVAPGELSRLTFELPVGEARADGATPVNVAVLLCDARGTPVAARTPLTLETSLGRWQADDLDPATPGLQIFAEGGRVVVPLVPPLEPGDAALRATSGVLETETALVFLPNLRPLIAVGVIEGTLHLRDLGGGGGLLRASADDGFEEELRAWSASGDDARLGAGARAAFFLKGKIRGDYLLTAAYDSEKAQRERLFRDIQPGEFYPVYGDASVRGFDAQSTGRLYVRIDKNRSYLLAGDFTTQPPPPASGEPAPGLSTYQRSLNGVKQHYENDRVSANTWVSQDSSRQVVEELPANGTSGPFQFSKGDVRFGSERIEVLVRDSKQASRVLSVRRLVRFVDYEFEPFTGRLLLNAPLPTLDPDFNPQWLRLTYEVDTGGPSFWTYGGDARVQVSERVAVGGTYARDEDPADTYELAGAHTTVRLGANTTVLAEAAESRDGVKGDGQAGRVELRHKSERTDVRAFYGISDESFRNPASTLLPGRIEGRFQAAQKLSDVTTLLADAILTEDIDGDRRRHGEKLSLERAFGDWRVEAGVHHTEREISSGDRDASLTTDSVRGKITAPLPRWPGATTFVEYEQNVRESDHHTTTLGLDAPLGKRGRLYGRHEMASTPGSSFEVERLERHRDTVVGLEGEPWDGGRSFSEYRADNELDGREAEAALGLRQLWRASESVRVRASFERVTPLEGPQEDESTAVTGGLEWSPDPRWRATTRIELRDGVSTDSLLHSLGYARRVTEDWTVLGKTLLLLTEHHGSSGGTQTQARVQSGFAWRPARADRWNALGKYELRHEADERDSASLDRRLVHILSGDISYQPSLDWTWNAHYATKWVEERWSGGGDSAQAHLLGSRWTRALTTRWDIGLQAWMLCDAEMDQRRYAVGPEIGVTLAKNLRAGLGYNFSGFHDRDFSSDGTTQQGLFLRLQFKFDEALLTGGRKDES